MTAPDRAVRTALITGIAGQDGRLLSSHLLSQGYQVVGLMRPGTIMPPSPPELRLIESDLLEPGLFEQLIPKLQPDEIYHLAAYHHSAQQASAIENNLQARRLMVDTNFGTCSALALSLLESGLPGRLVFAASSQMYLACDDITEIDESSPRNPATFYGHVKGWSTELLGLLRREHGLQASSAILFNHESRFRRPSFVSRKITLAASAAANGRPQPLRLLNIGARVDWSAAEDVVSALKIMAGTDIPQDCIVASGNLHSVRDLLMVAFDHVGLDWRNYTEFECDTSEPSLCGNSMRIKGLGWKPHMDFRTWVGRMVDHDLQSQT